MSGLNTNAWNRARYTLWAPLYDIVGRCFDPWRRRSLAGLRLVPAERLLIVGAGTGGDLSYLPRGVAVFATDLTPAMLLRARAKGPAHLALMNGHSLAVASGSIDAVVLHLILAVIPDPALCLREAHRVLRPGGRIAILDKFVADGAQASTRRRVANVLTSALATDITRRMGDILSGAKTDLLVESDEPAALGGLYRLIRLRRPGQPHGDTWKGRLS